MELKLFGQQLVFSANGQPSSCFPQLRLRLFQTGTSLVGAVNGGNIIWKFSFSLNNTSSRGADCSDGSSFESCSFYLGGLLILSLASLETSQEMSQIKYRVNYSGEKAIGDWRSEGRRGPEKQARTVMRKEK